MRLQMWLQRLQGLQMWLRRLWRLWLLPVVDLRLRLLMAHSPPVPSWRI